MNSETQYSTWSTCTLHAEKETLDPSIINTVSPLLTIKVPLIFCKAVTVLFYLLAFKLFLPGIKKVLVFFKGKVSLRIRPMTEPCLLMATTLLHKDQALELPPISLLYAKLNS